MSLVIIFIIFFPGLSVLLILIHVCVVGRAFRAVGRDIVIEGGSTGRASMSQEDLEKLPCYNFVAKSKDSSVNCAVCLENLEDGDKCRLLPMCKHSFHAHCVDAWLLKTPICPICRTSNDSRRFALIIGEEGSHFIDTSIEVRGSQTTENSQFTNSSISTESKHGLPTASSHLMSVRQTHTGESSDAIIELEQSEEESTQCIDRIESTETQPNAVPALDSTSEPHV